MTAGLGAVLATVTPGIGLLVLLGCYLSWRAGRLDRLHTRVDTARSALDTALARRCAAAVGLAASATVPADAARLLAEAAGGAGAHTGHGPARELAESELSRVLRKAAADGEPVSGPAAEVGAAAKRLVMARRFYNNAVAMTKEARASRVVRMFGLAGRAPMPEFFEMDDEPPVFRTK